MTNSGIGTDPEQVLALSYAARSKRPALNALFALDDRLATVLRTTREPLVGQMRLTWWHEALRALDTAPAPAEPVLAALAREALPLGVSGVTLAGMVEGWEALLDPLDEAVLRAHARLRGTSLFEAAGRVLGAAPSDPLAEAGEGWALADLALHLTDDEAVLRTRSLAANPIAQATQTKWSRAARSLGALTHLARMSLAVPPGQRVRVGSPGRVARMLLHRIGGR